MQDLSIDPEKGSLQCLPLLVGLVLLVAGLHWALWGENALAAAFAPFSIWALIAIFAAAVAVHEAIHGLTWAAAARLAWTDIHYGVLWKALTPYAHPRVPIPARAYRIGAAMPALILGGGPALAGLVTGSGPLSGWGALLLAFACGDLLILLKIRDVPGDAWVRDHPTRFGCVVLEPDEVEPSVA